MTALHDNPSIYPTLPPREMGEGAREILDGMPSDDPWRKCWEYRLTHEMTEGEGSAFWHGANLASIGSKRGQMIEWLDLLEKTHQVCAGVRMDTPEDQALHDTHTQQVADIIGQLRGLLA